MKNPTNFRKTVETGVDSCMSLLKPWITLELNFIMISFFAIEINIMTMISQLFYCSRKGISNYFRIYA